MHAWKMGTNQKLPFDGMESPINGSAQTRLCCMRDFLRFNQLNLVCPTLNVGTQNAMQAPTTHTLASLFLGSISLHGNVKVN